MLTLQELKRIADVPGKARKLPTAKQLRKSGAEVAREQIGQDAEISAYQNGCALYRVGNRSTVFSIHSCQDYLYLSNEGDICLPEQFFEHKQWHLRLVLEGEDRLKRNHEEKERRWNISYNAISEDWDVMGNGSESVVEHLINQETVKDMMQLLTEKQKSVLYGYYMLGKTQLQIAEELGVNRLTVRDSLVHAVSKIRKKYLLDRTESSNNMAHQEGLL